MCTLRGMLHFQIMLNETLVEEGGPHLIEDLLNREKSVTRGALPEVQRMTGFFSNNFPWKLIKETEFYSFKLKL